MGIVESLAKVGGSLMSEFCAIVPSEGTLRILRSPNSVCQNVVGTFHIHFLHSSTEQTAHWLEDKGPMGLVSELSMNPGPFASFGAYANEPGCPGTSRVRCPSWRMKRLYSSYWRGLHPQAVAVSPTRVSARKPFKEKGWLVVAPLPFGVSC
ncbi:unnamed protein product [Rangifer tarandus platyrhynchus]|uniref:Uncharacterized protein n=1 Tax=Rangifer tarandus platyrhynchus TaxID=3082113 RepID=A0ABN9A859_RANTA|nr:unnamed protein product [Rangifer tarandus platyrhynchus]